MSDNGLSYLLVKHGLYYRPESQGYTGIRDEAGRYLESDACPESGVTAIHEDDAPLFSSACWDDLKVKHLLGQITRSRTITKEQVEACAAALYAFDPIEQQETDLDFRPTSPVYALSWDEVVEMDDNAAEHFREQALAAAKAFGLTVEE